MRLKDSLKIEYRMHVFSFLFITGFTHFVAEYGNSPLVKQMTRARLGRHIHVLIENDIRKKVESQSDYVYKCYGSGPTQARRRALS